MVKAHAQPCFCQPLWREWEREKQPGRMIEETQRVSVHRGRGGGIGREPLCGGMDCGCRDFLLFLSPKAEVLYPHIPHYLIPFLGQMGPQIQEEATSLYNLGTLLAMSSCLHLVAWLVYCCGPGVEGSDLLFPPRIFFLDTEIRGTEIRGTDF